MMNRFNVFRAEKEVERINRENDVDSQVERIELLESDLEELKLENEILRNQQIQKYQHSSCNTPRHDQEILDKQKIDLDRAKTTNKFLLEGLQTRKQQLSDSQTKSFELGVKLEAANKKIVELLKEVRFLTFQIETLFQDRLQLHVLQEENEKLKSYLTAHHVDIRTGRRIPGYLIGKNKEKAKTPGNTGILKQKKKLTDKSLRLEIVDQGNETASEPADQYTLSYRSMFRESLKQKQS